MPKRGKLIAIEGGGSPAMELASKQLLRVLKKTDRNTGVSAWDASGVFYDLLQGDRMLPGASPQVLMMLYASDLAFRLRWQIEPALESGQTVVANCYVETTYVTTSVTQTRSQLVSLLVPPVVQPMPELPVC